ncbi:MAG: choice-of-anchor tandem repeat GloVer-containing protein [Candidatus Sulfotelmatobacter sp.]
MHNFAAIGTEGYYPYGSGLTLDSAGNLYGTTGYGGTHGAGTAFELSPSGSRGN